MLVITIVPISAIGADALFPANGASGISVTPTFTWPAVTGRHRLRICSGERTHEDRQVRYP